jgi:hypothetical protein
MKKLFSFCVALIALLVFVGCSGGGSGDSTETSLPSVENGFPEFNIDFVSIEKNIVYDYISKADFDKNVQDIENDGFACFDYECSKNSQLPNGINEAFAAGGYSKNDFNIDDIGHIAIIGIISNSLKEINEDSFSDIFPEIKGKKEAVFLFKQFSTDISSSLNSYETALINDGFVYDDDNDFYIKRLNEIVYICWYSSDDKEAGWIIAREGFYNYLLQLNF